MAILNILRDTDPALRKKSRHVDIINKRIITLLGDMHDTLEKADGVGLAAPQVGSLRRIAMIEVEKGELIEMINPEIIAREGEQEEIEGCLSSPGKWALTDRPTKVHVKYTDRHGKECEVEGEDLLARAFCHEIDHLDGILCFDNAKRIMDKDEVDEYKENQEKEQKKSGSNK
ncbi:peptide deformylase [Clostridia bacterium]|nr:peptide deformylase [Clostridia bacterium]